MLPDGGLPMRRREAIRFYRVLLERAARKGQEDLRQARRWLCRNDLFYLITGGAASPRPEPGLAVRPLPGSAVGTRRAFWTCGPGSTTSPRSSPGA